MFGDQKHDDRPADQKADRVDQPVVAVQEHQAGNTQEGRGGHVVARDGQTVLKPGDAAAGGVEILGGFRALRRPIGNPQRTGDENQKHDDRGNVERLSRRRAAGITGGQDPAPGEDQEQKEKGRKDVPAKTHSTSSLISRVSLSKTALARWM